MMMTDEIRHEARALGRPADDARLALAVRLARQAGRHAVAGSAALFPPDAAAYRGAPMPFLAGNCVAHAEAVAACRDTLASALEGLQ